VKRRSLATIATVLVVTALMLTAPAGRAQRSARADAAQAEPTPLYDQWTSTQQVYDNWGSSSRSTSPGTP
jgi:hypothetical protein